MGLGAVAESHLEAYARFPQLEVAVAVDPSPQRRQLVEQRFGVPTAGALDALEAADTEVAVVLTPTSTHRGLVERLVGSEHHVLCEKPLAMSSDDARAMEQAAESAGVLLGYGSSYRFMGAVSQAKHLISSGSVGDVRTVIEVLQGGSGPAGVEPRSSLHYPPGGPGGTPSGMLDHGIHMLDIVPWLAGSNVEWIVGRVNVAGAPPGPEWAAMGLAGGACGHLLLDDGTHPTALPGEGLISLGDAWGLDGRPVPRGRWARDAVVLHVHGSQASLRIYPYAHQLFRFDGAGLEALSITDPPAPSHFGRQLVAFCEAAEHGGPAPVPAAVGCRALELLEGLTLDPDPSAVPRPGALLTPAGDGRALGTRRTSQW